MRALRVTFLAMIAILSLIFLLGYFEHVVALSLPGDGFRFRYLALLRVNIYRPWSDSSGPGRRVSFFASGGPAGVVEASFPCWPFASGTAGLLVFITWKLFRKSREDVL